jgi:hypothetical protein
MLFLFLKVLLATLIAVAVQARPQADKDATIVSQTNENDGLGNYKNEFMASNGQSQSAVGELRKNPDPKESDFVVARGSYTGQDNDGNPKQINWEGMEILKIELI